MGHLMSTQFDCRSDFRRTAWESKNKKQKRVHYCCCVHLLFIHREDMEC